MLRRLSALTILLALVSTYLAPLAINAAAAPKQKKAPKRVSKLAPEFETAAPSGDLVRVLIQTKGRPSAAHDDAVKSKGGTKGRAFEALDAMTALVPRSSLASLSAREDIDYISPDRKVAGSMAVTREATGAALAQAGLQNTPGVTGKGVGIAIIDSGISASHPDFQSKNGKSRVVASVDFTGRGTAVSKKGIILIDSILFGDGILLGDGQDRDGHGTGVASVAAGNGAASQGLRRELRRHRPRGEPHRPQSPRRQRHGHDQLGHRRDQLGHRQPEAPQHPRHQHEPRRSGPRVLPHRPALQGGRARRARRHRRRRRRRQRRPHRRDRRPQARTATPSTARSTAPSTAPATAPTPSRSAPPTRTAPPAAPTTRWRSSPRKARRASTTCSKPDLVAPGRGVVAAMSQEEPAHRGAAPRPRGAAHGRRRDSRTSTTTTTARPSPPRSSAARSR